MAANKKRSLLKWVCFLAYLLFLSYLLFYSVQFDRTEHEDYRYNLTLFQEIMRYYNLGVNTGNWKLFVLNVLGNICVFLPIGMFLPSLFLKCKKFIFTTLLSFEISLCVEVIQLVTKVGSFDVDDLLLNTLGGICGFIMYSIYAGVRNLGKKRIRK